MTQHNGQQVAGGGCRVAGNAESHHPSPTTHHPPRGFSIRAEAGRAEILLYDSIDPYFGIGAKQFAAELKALGEVSAIDVRINSPGGEVFEGMAIHSILKRHPAKVTVHVDGVAASMASVVAMAGDEIVMADGAFLMIHNPLVMVIGEAEELRLEAELLDKVKAQLVAIYARRSQQTPETIAEYMDAETWFTAAEAVAAGFADRTSLQLALAASFDPRRFQNVPHQLREVTRMSQDSHIATPPALPQPAAFHELKAALPGAEPDFICQQLAANATIAQAQAALMAEQTRRLDESQQQVKTLTAEVATLKAAADAAAQKPGVPTLGNGTAVAESTPADPIAAFDEAVAAKVKAGLGKAKAICAVVRENPDLHAAYLEAAKAKR